jgi:hypothetical protein
MTYDELTQETKNQKSVTEMTPEELNEWQNNSYKELFPNPTWVPWNDINNGKWDGLTGRHFTITLPEPIEPKDQDKVFGQDMAWGKYVGTRLRNRGEGVLQGDYKRAVGISVNPEPTAVYQNATFYRAVLLVPEDY